MITEQIQKEIINEFKVFKNWQDQYRHLIKLCKKMPEINPEYKIDDNLIKGCQVKTWYSSYLKDGRVYYEVDSLSAVVKGISTLLLRIWSGQEPSEIVKTDLFFIDKVGLRENFAPIRANSLFKLVGRMKADAELYEKQV